MEFITYPQTNTETMLRIISECGKETGIIYCSWVNVASQNLSEKYYPDERMHSYISGIVKKPVFSLFDQFTRGHALFAGGHYIGSSDVESTVIGEIRSALKRMVHMGRKRLLPVRPIPILITRHCLTRELH